MAVVFHISVNSTLSKIVANVGKITTPLAMMVTGSTLADISFREIADSRLILFSVLRLLLYPFIYMICLLWMPFKEVRSIAVLLCALPVAGNVSMLCSEYEGNIRLAAKGIFTSIVLSARTIPVVLVFIQYMQ